MMVCRCWCDGDDHDDDDHFMGVCVAVDCGE